jgi:DNA-binding MarR family transcriptional regulator
MKPEKSKFNDFIKVIDSLAQLHEWEVKNFPLLTTLTGRVLYFRIAQRAIGNPEKLSKSMKNLAGDTAYTDKALRNRLQEMEKTGFIVMVEDENDGRCKYPMPTDMFYAAVYLHAEQMRRIFDKNYLIIDK